MFCFSPRHAALPLLLFSALGLATPAQAGWDLSLRNVLRKLTWEKRKAEETCSLDGFEKKCNGGTLYQTLTKYYEMGEPPKPEQFPKMLSGRFVSRDRPDSPQAAIAFFEASRGGGPLGRSSLYLDLLRRGPVRNERLADRIDRGNAQAFQRDLRYAIEDNPNLAPLRLKRDRAFWMNSADDEFLEFRGYDQMLIVKVRSIQAMRRSPDAPVTEMMYFFTEPQIHD